MRRQRSRSSFRAAISQFVAAVTMTLVVIALATTLYMMVTSSGRVRPFGSVTVSVSVIDAETVKIEGLASTEKACSVVGATLVGYGPLGQVSFILVGGAVPASLGKDAVGFAAYYRVLDSSGLTVSDVKVVIYRLSLQCSGEPHTLTAAELLSG